MLRRVTLGLILLAGASVHAPAQERPPRLPARASAWTSLSVGLFQLQDMYDPGSDSGWDFGNIVQFRGTLERALQSGTSAGIVVTFARAPLTYVGADCGVCDADAALWQALAMFRIGGGGFGLHQVIELEAGVTGFSSFTQRSGGSLAPGTVIDPTLNIGYGLGYSLGPSTQLTLVQQVGLLVHRRGERPAGDESSMPRASATRVGLRFGLGGWR